MKTVELSTETPTLSDLLSLARQDSVLVTAEDGDSFLLTRADEFDTEVQLLRRNHRFLAMLNELKKDRETIPLEEAERRLR